VLSKKPQKTKRSNEYTLISNKPIEMKALDIEEVCYKNKYR
jgi:hypothetical protein